MVSQWKPVISWTAEIGSRQRSSSCTHLAARYVKKEETDRYRYRTFEQLKASILGYIDGYYNSRRLHSSIGYMTPNEKDASFYRKG